MPEERVLSTLNKDGSRRWITPRPSRGRFLTARRIVAYTLIFIFTVIPYIRLNGKPLILLDLTTRHFTIFGATFLPTDTILLSLFMVSVFVAIFLLTALFGRVWCGWACPQTVYMEFLFRPIERLFDGTPGRVKKKGWIVGTGLGKILKYATYLIVSLYLAHTFLAYFVGVEKLVQWVQQSPLEHPASFLVMLATTALMMFDFTYFREQTCILACPYGRFQSVLMDRHSLIVSYDAKRGEPRGKRKQGASKEPKRPADARRSALPAQDARLELPVIQANFAPRLEGLSLSSEPAAAVDATGDCVDCRMCVMTCPTGIDIRDGLQMECIGCAQCIDACDAVMTKIGRPRGLIRYSSQSAMAGERPKLLRPRVVVYPLILVILAGLFVMTLLGRGPADVTVLRGLGKPFVELPSGEIANQVRVKIVNRTPQAATFEVSALGVDGVRIESEANPVSVEAGQSSTTPMLVVAPQHVFQRGRCDVTIRVSGPGGFAEETTYRLMGPGVVQRTGTTDAPRHDDGDNDAEEAAQP